MSNTILRNENVSVTLKSLGGELTSIKDASGTEYLWQGNPDFWSGQAPVLFPIVGCLRNGTATIGDSKTCSFGRHGLARKLEFTLISSSETCAVYSLKADDSTKEQYPYDFELQMIYELTDHGVKVSHKVINHGDIVMPYCIGGHPAFNCPMYEGENFEDYIVEFEQPETAACAQLTDDALIFDQLKSRTVALKHKESGHGILVTFPDFDYLGVWSSANDGPFVALEPWSGTSTCSDEDDVFEHKRGVRFLEPGEHETLSFVIEILI